MTPEESKKTDGGGGAPLDAELRKDLGKQLAMFLPMLLIAMIGAWLKDTIVNHPERALLVILPAFAIQVLFLVKSTTKKAFRLGWPFLVFLSIYILTFYVAAESRILDWKRTLVGYEDTVPRNFLALNSSGDWHYRVVSEEPALPNIVIVLMKRPETFQQGRLDIADLMAVAETSGATGVALDAYFDKYKQEKEEEDRGIDEILCSRFEEARKKGLRVFAAYDFEVTGDRVDKVPIDPDLKTCLPDSDQGHMIGYAEHDGFIRSIPLFFWNDPAHEALSLKVARALNSTVEIPSSGLLQFTKPKNEFARAKFEELNKPDADRSILNGRFILAGEDSAQDSFSTPFGVKPGAIIHAYAVQSLIRNRFIKRPPWWVSLFLIAVWCYLLMVLTARGVRNFKLILTNAAISILVVGISALAMRLWLTWIDLIYPLVAAWLFLILLIALRRIGLKRMRPASG